MTAAAKAPISIIPSRAILTTPERSETNPPSAANNKGVETLKVEASTGIKVSRPII
jgi:hypothetical protein